LLVPGWWGGPHDLGGEDRRHTIHGESTQHDLLLGGVKAQDSFIN
jgi:hypothetical protein